MGKDLSRSKVLAVKVIFEAFKVLKQAGGQLKGKELIKKIEENVPLDEWEKGTYEKTGYTRWISIMRFYTIDCVKAGYLSRQNGVWYLTYDGEEAMKLGPVELLESATKAYRKWRAENSNEDGVNNSIGSGKLNESEQVQKATLEKLEEDAIEGISEFIKSKNPYEIQDLVAALLRSMGYYTPFISPKGRDGGIDIVAYKDPLGTSTPRIKVQVKHRPDSSIAVDEIRSLIGLLNKGGDVGLFVTTGKFTLEAERFSRDSHIHVKLIDFSDLVSLWKQFYNKLQDEEKNLLPLHPIYFLGTNE